MKKYILGLAVILLFVPVLTYSAITIAERLQGRILLQVEENGEAWFVTDLGTRIYMNSPVAAFEILRKYALGISNADLEQIPLDEQAYTLGSEAVAKYQTHIQKETIFVDRVIEKPVDRIVERIVYLDSLTGQTVEPAPEQVVQPKTPQTIDAPIAGFSATRNSIGGVGVVFQSQGDDFVIEVMSIQGEVLQSIQLKESIRKGQSLQLGQCSVLNSNWLEFSGIPYPQECATHGYFQTDHMGRIRIDAIQVGNGQKREFGWNHFIPDGLPGTLENIKAYKPIIKYLKAIGQNTGTVVVLRDI